MQAPLTNVPSTLECPRCGKHAIVSPRGGIYQCLNCNFERDLSNHPPGEQAGGTGAFVFASLGFLVTLLLFL